MAEVTQILSQIDSGDLQAAEQVLPLVYDELRKLAAARLALENPGQTLQATALVHEAYLRLVGSSASGAGLGYATQDRGHGRVEERDYFIAPVPEDFAPRNRWTKLRALGIVINNVEREGKHLTEVRYYILSKYTSDARFAEAVRGNWSIENRWHWHLDMGYGGDYCRLWRDHAPANFSLLRRTSLSLLKNEPKKKLGIKNKRLAAAFDTNYLEQVLLGKQVSVRSPCQQQPAVLLVR